jgi:hypothetical protein
MPETSIRRDIEFNAEGTRLRGWLYLPAGRGPFATVILAHGFSGLKEHFLDNYAELIQGAGLAALVYDHRNFGASDGEPRQEIDPWAQVRDYRHAITYATTLPEVDGRRIGIFGSSYSGGHVFVVAAIDRRVRCVVSQVPLVSGEITFQRLVRGPDFPALRAAFDADRRQRFLGGAPAMIPVAAPSADVPAALPGRETWEFFEQARARVQWRNEVTLRSCEMGLEYEPGIYIERIAPTPVRMVVASEDTLTPTDVALAAYARAREPKSLVLVPGSHFAPYVERFDIAGPAARDWFVQHLGS